MKLAFFGLTPEYKQSVHSSIFMLLYKVPGFTHSDLYNMPIHLRTFYLKEYNEWKKAENESAEQQQNPQQSQEQAYEQYKQMHQHNSDK